MDFLLNGLNEAQKKVVLHKDGPLLVLAGAGSGKTKSISHRIAHMASQGVAPEKILAITFTNKAAGEMRERVFGLLEKIQVVGNSKDGPWKRQHPFVSTFHSLGVYILKKHGSKVGVPANFSILSKEDSLDMVKEAIKELSIDPKQFQPNKMQSLISRQKGDLFDAESYFAEAGSDFFGSVLGKIWKKYEENLREHKALDFDDLVSKVVFLLKKDAEVRDYYQNLWDYILIDEYQDTNKSQYELSKILAARHKNICAVGDMDQCIYAFRGADFRNIINFEKDYPEHVAVALEENYRSTQNILEAAAKIIEKNKVRKPKGLYTKNQKGAEISLFEAMGEYEEAEFVAHKIKEILARGGSPSEISVLFRANFQSRVFEEACLKHGIAYQMLGTQFYERKEIKDVLAYLRAALNREDLLSVKRAVNVPSRGIGKVSLLNKFSGKKLPAAMEKKFEDFFALLDSIKENTGKEKASAAISFIIKKSGLEELLENGDSTDKERLENLKELVSIATRYDNLPEPEGVQKLLEDASLMSAQDAIENKEEKVRLMTAHAAKGLEFKNVFIVGLEEGLFPHSGMGSRDRERDEEERRLFYVAVTRAKEKLFLSFAVSRMIYGGRQMNMPSRFLSDIPDYLYKMEEFRGEPPEEVIRYG
ncbi:MAG: UvrD-helicase domain-containing protein [Candidatus Paceibacter sp.]|nr:UvrD-helicase domain-containing protein [Candidatus Paceibacter sp.]